MLTAHETVKTAWSNFKTYPRLKEIIIFNFLAALPLVLVPFLTNEEDALAQIITVIGSIPSLIVYYLAYISVTHYVCKGWIFNNFHEFMNPPSSIWRVFWKTIVVFFMVFIPFILIIAGASYGITTVPVSGQIVLTIGLIAVVIGLVIYMVKIYLVIPYFTMNSHAKILSSLTFSDGYFWYLSKILGWIFLYGILLFIMMAIGFALFGILEKFLGDASEAIFTCCALLVQSLITIICSFIYAETYKQIFTK